MINKITTVSFDFDGSLDDFFDGTENPYKKDVRDWVKTFKEKNYNVYIITRRFGPENSIYGANEHIKVFELANELDIQKENIVFTNREWKHSFVKSVGASIHIDDEIDEKIFMEKYHPDAKVIWLGDKDWHEQLVSII